MAPPILVQKDEGPSLSLAGPPGLAVFLRDLDTDRRAKTGLNSFGTMSLCRILDRRWHDYVSDDLILSKTRFTSFIRRHFGVRNIDDKMDIIIVNHDVSIWLNKMAYLGDSAVPI